MKINFYNSALCLLFSVMFYTGLIAQDVNFSQFYDIPVLRNPALSGLFDGDIRLCSGYRNQWQSVTVPYRTMALSGEFKKVVSRNTGDFLTFGFQMTNDVAGDSKLTRTQALPFLNFHKSLSMDKNMYLSAAFMGGPVFSSFDPTKLKFDDQYLGGSFSATNPTRQSFSRTSNNYWDPSFGISFSNESGENTSYYIGLGMYHFTNPKVSFQSQNDFKLNRKYVMNFGLTSKTNDFDRLIVYADLFSQGGARLAQGGLMYKHDLVHTDDDKAVSVSGGLFYRLGDAVIPVVKLDYYQFSLGATYDINVSKLVAASQSRGGLEVTLTYKAFSPNHVSDEVYRTKCPKFF
jgi:type IX secretion system PorP/SprF family membrane protein